MTLQEKIGQLFVHLCVQRDEAYLREIVERYHVGGIRYGNAPAAEIRQQNAFLQSISKVPLLIASNIESGGNGSCSDGTLVGTPLQCAATGDAGSAYTMGRVGGVESAAVGCNWAYAPVVDIQYNWRNTVVATRCFGDNPENVIDYARAYVRGVRESGIAATLKHFPGDGVDERDQHLLTSYNTMSCEEWDASYGRVYRAMIDEGVQSVLVGHIGLPEYSRRLRPGIADQDIMPASLAPELVTGLLREQLGFNGLILTDASSMLGFMAAARRRDQIPGAIAAGCDMVLYFKDPDEDFGYMLDGCGNGTISPQRLEDALRRILGLKAALGLHARQADGRLVPTAEALAKVGCVEHRQAACDVADKSITLVKDTANNLPITPETHRRLQVFVIGEDVAYLGVRQQAIKSMIVDELRQVGFDVDLYETLQELQARSTEPINVAKFMMAGSSTEFTSKYDAALVFANVWGFSQENSIRIKWSSPMSNEIPWYVTEVPTVFISLNQPNHLVDVPMVKTYVNAYAPTRTVVHSVIRKIMGESEFQGCYSQNVFCDLWDTRL